MVEFQMGNLTIKEQVYNHRKCAKGSGRVAMFSDEESISSQLRSILVAVIGLANFLRENCVRTDGLNLLQKSLKSYKIQRSIVYSNQFNSQKGLTYMHPGYVTCRDIQNFSSVLFGDYQVNTKTHGGSKRIRER
ncbi:uncharacterized protein [Typha latifolia]|uniref:uncharacterized protein n=1 Tax=Typha latifolia TaxID=4733 RepID=UPI003C2FBB06